MQAWKNGLLATAMFAAGCTGQIVGSDGTGPGATNTPGGGNPSSPNSPSAPSLPSTVCKAGIPATSQIRRLTNAQYERVVYDLLGVSTLKSAGNVAPSVILATDQDGSLTDIAWSTYQSVADMIATQVVADATLKKKFMTCTPTGDGKTCFHDTIVNFGRKAFRRPLNTAELAAFDALVANGAKITATGSLDDISQVLLYAFLVSPSFLQRSEIGTTADNSGQGHFQLTSQEVANRLSFMLWGTVPDDVLIQAADQGQLASADQIKTQAARMMKDDRARDKVAAFHRYYLLMATNSRWDNANHDTTLFPTFNKTAVPALQGEMEKFFDDVVFKKNGSFQDLLLSNTGFVTAQTAATYGLDPSKFGADYTETKLDATQRPGFLTRAGFLGAYSAYSRSSPILRGAFVAKQILGTVIAAPPPGAEAATLPSSADLDTNRKQVDAQTSATLCATCHHEFINPPGFVLDAFNSVGQWQTKESTTGIAIDTQVNMQIDGKLVPVSDPLDLMKKIAASPMAQHRYANRWVSYAYEREDDLDCGTINDVASKIAAGSYTITNLIADLTQAQSFRVRATDGVN